MPERALADAGYCNEAELSRPGERGADARVALARDRSARPAAERAKQAVPFYSLSNRTCFRGRVSMTVSDLKRLKRRVRRTCA